MVSMTSAYLAAMAARLSFMVGVISSLPGSQKAGRMVTSHYTHIEAQGTEQPQRRLPGSWNASRERMFPHCSPKPLFQPP
jgi:hypothetical protein